MKLRVILLVLSILAFLSASIGGYMYYAAIRAAALNEAERLAVDRLEITKKNLSAYLSENLKPVRTLAGMEALQRTLLQSTPANLESANSILDHFRETLDVDVCYLMDRHGMTVASSNRDDSDSFIGQNFSFRPYFKKAVAGKTASYLALGTTSGRRGAYFSHPVAAADAQKPLGVAVIKASIYFIEKELGPSFGEILLVTDPHGLIFISNQKEWLYHFFVMPTASDIDEVRLSRQFGSGPWPWIGLRINGKTARDADGVTYLINQAEITNYPGWKIIELRSVSAITKNITAPFIRVTGPVVLALCVLVGLSVLLLYRGAIKEILMRRSVEQALRQSEERYRSLYHHTPAMLHSIDRRGRLVSVSDYWLDVMGYEREEVIGKNLTRFFTRDSRRKAEDFVIEEFFKVGFCKDIPYQFVKKNGELIDVLLSAIADRDDRGRIVRSLAVSIDVTERKKAEEALRRAQIALSEHTRNLERQVAKRTREISGILKYTPAVVYIKDSQMRYVLVNSRFEELFAVESQQMRGKSDYDMLSVEVADQFRANDQRVLDQARSFQVTERILQKDGMHTYLSVKFPIYDENSLISGVCGILTDITPLEKARDQLRRLSGSIMAGQEKERSAIARELHDELGQVLTALRMDSVWILEHLKKTEPKAAERAETMCRLIDATIEEVRGMAIRLRPGVLDDLGLVAALEWYTADFERRTGIACVFECGDVPSVSAAVATAFYRIGQEALTNVARHAGASRAAVALHVAKEELTLVVQDDGCGFDPCRLSESEGLGVAGMQERAALLDGRFEIFSKKGEGTTVTFKIRLTTREYELQ